jgi:Thioredoxin reductase
MIAVIGSGPAGISAALYIKRANVPVTIFTNHKSALEKAKSIENYYGTGAVSGNEIYNKGIISAKELDIDIIEEEILNITFDSTFKLESNNNEYLCDSIVLATGAPKKKLNIPGISEFEGKGISYCATCDGFFFKNKKIAVIGSGNYAKHEYEYLKNISDDITNIDIDDIVGFNGNNHLETITLKDQTILNIDGAFIALDYPDSSALAKKIGIIEKNGQILVDNNMQTNIPGLYACGDATPGVNQIAKAVYEGMIAANRSIEYYRKKKS